MAISKAVSDALQQTSWIRRMFEEGRRLKAEHGEAAVADLSLGNPVVEPPPAVLERLRAVAADEAAGTHRYMPNAGLPGTRDAVAAKLEASTGVPFRAEQIVMTVGAAGGLNVLMKSLLDPRDEVILLAPFFAEYVHYARNFGGVPVPVPTTARFRPDPDAIERAITERTRALILNSPNNPTGAVYDAADLDRLAAVLRRASARHGRPVYLISDEPYRRVVYGDARVPWPVHHYRDTVLVHSFSKDLALPGERIGYVAVHPEARDADELQRALVFAMRALGFVNAPAIQQRLVETLLEVMVDLEPYASNRARLLEALHGAGYEVVDPEGAFYLFPKTPGGLDDVHFCRACLEERLLVVPGSGFGAPGHFRLAYAVAAEDVDRAAVALPRIKARVEAAAGA